MEFAYEFGFNWPRILHHLVSLGIAYLLAFPIGWNREAEDRSAGLRTFPLVALGACGFSLVGIHSIPEGAAHARVLYGVITGIGFLGGGAILKDGGNVRGTATAASLWITGAIGAAVAFRRFEVAILLSVVNVLTLYLVAPLKTTVHGSNRESDDGNQQ